MTLTLKETGEFGFIDRIRKMLPCGTGVERGIGDDAAVLRIGNKKVLFTTDMILEDRHFVLGEASGFEIGWKALSVNLSDIAAMGGVPTHAVVALGMPARLPLRFAVDITKGICALARRFRVNVVGGDTNASEKLIVSVALLGEAPHGLVTTRSGARPGDIVFVSGFLGGSAASRKHLRFIPRLREAGFLTAHFNVHAMMDISDGLASDIHRLCEQSGTGVCLSEEAIPRQATVTLKQALTDGEDFELLFTLSAKDAARLVLFRPKRSLTPFHEVGKIMPKPYGIRLVTADGASRPLKPAGFDHYR